MSNINISQFLREKKIIIILLAIIFFLIEVEIFSLAILNSGKKSYLQIINDKGNIIYESNGKNLSEFNKYYFERIFGPLENYEAKLLTQNKPFPFRAWFVATIGIPIGIVLLFSFILKAYFSFFDLPQKKSYLNNKLKNNSFSSKHKTKFDIFLNKINDMNIFLLGSISFLIIISCWIIPDMLKYIGSSGINTIIRFKQFFVFIICCIFLMVIWIIYLKYRLAQKTIKSKTEIEKHRLKLQFYINKKLSNNDMRNIEPGNKIKEIDFHKFKGKTK